MKFVRKILDRLKEPSSYASLAAGLAIINVSVDAELLKYITAAGTGVAGIIGFFLAEKGEKKNA